MRTIPLRKKYREPKASRRNPYRSRTGPRCCSDNCPATKKPYLISGLKKERRG